jgi:choline dehydrogenase-like flavoprotein
MSWKEAKAAVAELDVAAHKATIGSAHVMGGCSMGDDPKQSVANCDGKFHHLDNLYIMDGSLFPTSIGANPQLSIYGLVYKLSTTLLAQPQPSSPSSTREKGVRPLFKWVNPFKKGSDPFF